MTVMIDILLLVTCWLSGTSSHWSLCRFCVGC